MANMEVIEKVNVTSAQSTVVVSSTTSTVVPLDIPQSGNMSPHPSPKLSPKSAMQSQLKKDLPRSYSHNPSPSTSTSYCRDPSPIPCDSKVETSESLGNVSRSSDSNIPEFVRSISQECPKDSKEVKDRKESRGSDRVKKKSWYHALTPTYKSRSEEFKRYFKELPPEERLIVDYSCAVQKDILVQGRLYVTQNYLCFYANYLLWGTSLCIQWKDVTHVSKEKTALIIPNAISISTRREKHMFTTFNARDKAYITLFRIWQKSLIDEPIDPKLVWEWVHEAYGAELGLSSDDEYYDRPAEVVEPIVAARHSAESLSEQEMKNDKGGSELGSSATESTHKSSLSISCPPKLYGDIIPSPETQDAQLPTDLSDTTESDVDRNPFVPGIIECVKPHEGRCLVKVTLPCTVDQLFTLLFTHSKFFLEFHALRHTTDIKASSWQPNPENGEKMRNISMLVALSQTIGPRSSSVSETQVMQSCSKPGWLYAIDGEVLNSGIPYCDSFYVEKHYCLTRTSDNECNFSVYAQLKYKKAVFILVKNVIEKNTWAGLEDFYESLMKALQVECEEINPKVRKQRRRQHRGAIKPVLLPVDELTVSPSRCASIKKAVSVQNERRGDTLNYLVLAILLILLMLNGLLYYKLWRLEAWSAAPRYSLSHLDLEVLRNPPKTPEAWIELYRKQESLHREELSRWKTVLQTSVHMLRNAEEALSGLHTPTSDSTSSSSSPVENIKRYSEQQRNHEL